MKNYDELTNDLLKRRDRYVAGQKAKHKIIVGLLASISCLCVVTLLGVCLWQQALIDKMLSDETLDGGITSEEKSDGNVNEDFVPNSTPYNTSDNNTLKPTTQPTSRPTPTLPGVTNDPLINNEISLKNIDNGVLKKAMSQKMDVPENMKLLSTSNASEENITKIITANVALYELDGDVVNWLTENDLLYVITQGNNRLVVIDSKTMRPVFNVPLAGKPAEMNFIEDKIYISLPDLCRIDIFSKSTSAKLSSLYFDHEVSSFCIDGNYIYYSEHDQHCKVYRKNLTTNELTNILPNSGFSFYQPKLYLNKEDNILYIGETGGSGCALFYFDATTLELKSLFKKNDYGIVNHTRDIFHIGDEIFWGNYRLSDTEAKQIVGRYGVAEYGSINFASKEIVSTYEGLFLTDTYECVINYFDAGFKYEYILVSESYNVFFRERNFNENVIIGVNFNVQ